MANEISIVIRAKNLLARGLKAAGAQVAKFGRAIGTAVRRGAIVAAAALAGLVVTARKLIAIYQIQAQAEAKLAGVLKATGYAAGFTTREIKKQARELQKLTGIGDEVIINTQAILATFRNIKGDQFKEATNAILAMQTVLAAAGKGQKELEDGAVRIGKALNDPIKGMAALGRAGVVFTAAQRAQVKALQESGDMIGAQKILLAELKLEFGDVTTLINDDVKAWNGLKAAAGDVAEKFGKAITEGASLTETFGKLQEKLEALQESGAIEKWAVSIKRALDDILPGMRKLLKAFEVIHDAIRDTAAFAGSLSTKAGYVWDTWNNVKEAADEANQSIREGADAVAAQVAEIKNANKAAEDWADTQERIAMAVGRVAEDQARDDAAALAAQKEYGDAVKANMDAVVERGKKIIDLQERRAALMKDIQDAADTSKAVSEIDKEIAAIQRLINAELGLDVPVRAADRAKAIMAGRKEIADVAADDQKRGDRLARNRERLARGKPLTKRARDEIKQADAVAAIDAANKPRWAAIDALEAKRAKIQSDQLKALQSIDVELKKNLQVP